jgi:hypothetical protein
MANKDTQKAVIRHAQADMADLPSGVSATPAGPAKEAAKTSAAPSTSSVLWAEWRRGLKDLQNAVLNAFPDHAAQHEEPGSIANPTQLEVYQEKHNDQPSQEYDPGEFARSGGTKSNDRGRGR